ncbi:MAG: two pore domain potassium channel family protein [Eggerthellaceae bacterium]|nr:two pore domain potassium channel family protein [Eggerthellaceae bacterium]
MERNNVSFLKPRAIGLIIKASGLLPSTIAFIALFLVCSVLVALFEPNVNGFANSLWFMFQVVTTIGLGDFTATSFVGRAAAVVLSVYSVFFLALITGVVVSFCSERMRARRGESIAHFLDQLEHLPELSTEELTELSEKVKSLKGTAKRDSEPITLL